jgi:hypothetical protein
MVSCYRTEHIIQQLEKELTEINNNIEFVQYE